MHGTTLADRAQRRGLSRTPMATPRTQHNPLTRIGETGTFFLLVLLMLGGCASKGQVREEVSRLSAQEAKLVRLESELAELEIAIAQEDAAVAASQGRFEEAQATAAQAAEEASRAEAAAAGGLMGEPVFRLDGLRFEPGTAALTSESKILLDQLADRLRAEDVAYYVEIQTPEP